MIIRISATKENLGKLAAEEAVEIIKKAMSEKDCASIILATDASQFQVLKFLVSSNRINWSKVVIFHLDEYIGLPITHPASFRKYLINRFVKLVPALKEKFLINGEAKNPHEECERLGKIIAKYQIDVAFVGIGENGHLAFNDPPANFNTEQPYILVQLDEDCRRLQLSEGWFPSLEVVPHEAISMSIH